MALIADLLLDGEERIPDKCGGRGNAARILDLTGDLTTSTGQRSTV